MTSKPSKWEQLLIKAKPSSIDISTNQEFINDKDLKNKIKTHIGAKTCSKDIERKELLEIAFKLNLISQYQKDQLDPPKKGKTNKSWNSLVKEAKLKDKPIKGNWISNDELKTLLESHIGNHETVPEKYGRDILLQQAVQLNLITKERASLPPPKYLEIQDLKDLLTNNNIEFKNNSNRQYYIELCLENNLVSDIELEAKKIRSDKKAKAEEAKVTKEKVIKIGINAFLKGFEHADKIKQTIVDASDSMSHLATQRSYLVWLHLHRLIQEGKLETLSLAGTDLEKFIRHCYVVGAVGSTTKSPEIEKTVEKYKELFPLLPLPKNFRNVVTHAANSYAGAFKRHFTCLDTVMERVKKYIRAKYFDLYVRPRKGQEDTEDFEYPNKPDLGDNPLYNIISALQDPTFPVNKMHPKQQDILKEIKEIFGLPEKKGITENWLRKEIINSIKFTYETVSAIDKVKILAKELQCEIDKLEENKRPKLCKGTYNGIKFVPINKAHRRFILLDPEYLLDLVDQEKKFSNTQLDRSQLLRSLFRANIKATCGNQYIHEPRKDIGAKEYFFTGSIDTDGMSVCLHFRRGIRQHEVKTYSEDPEKVQTKEKVKLYQQVPKSLLLVDTGRVNIVKMTLMVDGKVKYVGKKPFVASLSAKHYYSANGTFRARKIYQRRVKCNINGIKTRNDELSKYSIKTGSESEIVNYLKAFNKSWNKHWTDVLRPRYSQSKRRQHMLKDRTLLKFFHKVRKKINRLSSSDSTVVVWGVKVAATGRGNLPVPTGRVYEIAKQIPGWKIVSGDEYKSSQLSSKPPHVELAEVRVVAKSESKTIRKRGKTLNQKVRNGYIIGLDYKRQSTRKNQTELTYNKLDKKTKWLYDGHSLESESYKLQRRDYRKEHGLKARYVRGLRVFQDLNTTKFVDRDINASINIGLIWIGDNVVGYGRPTAFCRNQTLPKDRE